eukprot:CAMPEP_0202885066 /NCGR_PEP_ID=MMETSP1391-20130828/41472_1 /ASSEMBLY_ACC=CAM_ASM_000867 /TAXON_ID=1034604 /ORGANISM="Chlamydomonas leiostraca, Strain SAG 11-49" /LENGTH=113 /DNA_ID=CAMNT_0049568305 /DNA_START=575 /DNA_END=916 /DNA_ORIENTATION=+
MSIVVVVAEDVAAVCCDSLGAAAAGWEGVREGEGRSCTKAGASELSAELVLVSSLEGWGGVETLTATGLGGGGGGGRCGLGGCTRGGRQKLHEGRRMPCCHADMECGWVGPKD